MSFSSNNLNQYVSIAESEDEFTPQFDDDGNQMLVKTSTGIWQVAYNGENRPVSWTCGSTNITMKFDRMGRRVEYLETVTNNTGGPDAVSITTNSHHRFVYDGYLCIQRLNAAANNSIDLAFGWDSTEPVATRPLWMQRVSGTYNFFYFHDGNKNVSDLVSYQSARGVPAHYEYAPFGAVTATSTNTAFTAFNVAEVNPFRFSSEYSDDALGLVYYNYRHYNPDDGRWCARDPIDEDGCSNLYGFCGNQVELNDAWGLVSLSDLAMATASGGFSSELFSIPIGPGSIVLTASGDAAFSVCCDKESKQQKTLLAGSVTVELFYRVGGNLPVKKNFKGRDRNVYVPHPCRLGEMIIAWGTVPIGEK